MSDVVEQAKAALARRWENPGGTYPDPVPRGVVELGDWASEEMPELVAEVEELRAVVSADDSTAARIHRQWTQARRQVRELRAEVERLRRVTDIIDPDSVYREQRDQARAELENVRRRLAEKREEARTQLLTGHISEARYYAGRVDGLRDALSAVSDE
ncbi:hypothetical protein OF855_24615 [Mycolicibacterium fortuitum]|uniref:hypothetical protein n=1 Tax=Mycolicibacterium fortuitum TaxID=1766 RepID=UPI0022BA5E1D|nr:hypothetical protein [Mycolicibacterium fortuitum]WAY18424.1 hypothetical protein OF855_24615 [Mycolicibacterium fortuitum]